MHQAANPAFRKLPVSITTPVTSESACAVPFTTLRQFDCVFEATKPAVLAKPGKWEKPKLNPEPFLLHNAWQLFYYTSPLDINKLMGDQDRIKQNLLA